MSASQQHIHAGTPLGANLVDGGVTFRTWAPNAREVYVAACDPGTAFPVNWQKNPDDLLVRDPNGYWGGFFPGLSDGDEYRFFVVGPTGIEGFKRDPYARELVLDGYPECNCIVRDPDRYVWHDQGYRTPDFSDLIVYQLHFGVFFAEDGQGNDIRRHRVCKFLDVVNRIEYLADLGVNAIMPLPFQEYQGANSLGYNGTDLFSPEMDYTVRLNDLPPYLAAVNRLLQAKGHPPMTLEELSGQISQLKTLVDLCHLYGIAVIMDVVYNHAGGGFDAQSLYFFDQKPPGDNADSLYFLRDGHAGGLVFDFRKPEVRQFLIDNGKMLLQEYHMDGLRYDQVTVIDEHGGWFFCQDLTDTLRFVKPEAVQIAEYWAGERWKGIARRPHGMGFDLGYSGTLRDTLRRVIGQTSGGAHAPVQLEPLRDALRMTYADGRRWTVYQCIENHDLLDFNHGDRQPRIPALADPSDARSWYARSRARVAAGLLMTAPGVPMLFMGQEFLEQKYWTDWQGRPDLLIDWAGQQGRDRHMVDYHRFMRDLLRLRRRHPALRSNGLNVFHCHNGNRILAFHRWVPGTGRHVVVVAGLNENTFYDHSYRIGMPFGGHWHEVFNSDVYDTFFNPVVQGNPGGLDAGGPGWDGLPFSATLTLPANSLLVFAQDRGDF
ncbi:alpha amylase C-terminal domain-containing protein [Larkinella soli]|uniref:alpha amylase C-terminal domain-containing protein n=1 Tax=Larkinella soli TaxID=1770527 RepID=UPI000FFB4E9F|nr:alpha-amylase family glycosyl hydrolase [Larkinella soli]